MSEIINNQETSLCKRVAGTNHINVIEISCTWTIYNFSFLSFMNDDDDDEIESHNFLSTCGGRLMSNVSICMKKDHLKVFSYIPEIESYPFVDCKISIVNNKGEVAHTVAISDFEHITDFILKKDLYDKKKELLVNDKLVLLFQLKAFPIIEEWNLDTNKDKDCSCEIFRNKVGLAKEYEMLTDGKYSNVIFAVNQTIFHLHKSILAARSQVFSAMFGREMLERANNTVAITDTSSEVFKIVVEYIYSGSVNNIHDFPQEFVLQVLVAADKYDLAGLKNMCEIICFNRLSLRNAIDMLIFADLYNINWLKSHVISYIVAHDQDFVNDPLFQSLFITHSHLPPQFIETKTKETNSVDNAEENSCEQHKHISMSYPSVERKYWSVSKINVDKWSFKWTIHDFKFHLSKNKSNSLSSQTFKNNYIWQLSLSLRNDSDDEDNDFVSLYVQVSSEDPSDWCQMKAQYEIFIITSDQAKVECIKSDIVTLIVNDEKKRMKRLKKSFLLSNAKELLPNDILTIECNMKFSLEMIYEDFGPAECVRGCDYKHLLAFSSDLERLLAEGQFSDITLVAGQKEFLLHRTVLAVRCPCLLAAISQQLLHHNEQTAQFVDIDPEVFKELLLFIYSGKINNLKNFAKSLYAEAEKYELEKLKCICEAYLCNNLTVDNACDTFVFAHTHKNKKLKDTAAQFIAEDIAKVVNTPGYESIRDSRPQLLKDIISKFQM